MWLQGGQKQERLKGVCKCWRRGSVAFPQDRDTEYSEEELGGQSPGLEARSPELESGSVFWIWDSWARD